MTEKLVCNLHTGKWAPQGGSGSDQTGNLPAGIQVRDQRRAGVFSNDEKAQIGLAVQEKYKQVADSAAGKFKYETGRSGACALGYDEAILKKMPDEVLESFCGVGNPFSIEDVQQGERVLDIGCGAGFDLIVALHKVGDAGRVCGIDLTAEMLAKAQRNFARLGLQDIETKQVSSEKLPYDDNTFDTVISNGVINLSPAKAELFTEIHRVLKPGGRLQFADIVLDAETPSAVATSFEAWAQWVGGVIPVRDQIELMNKAGFVEAECVGKTTVKTADNTVGTHFLAKCGLGYIQAGE